MPSHDNIEKMCYYFNNQQRYCRLDGINILMATSIFSVFLNHITTRPFWHWNYKVEFKNWSKKNEMEHESMCQIKMKCWLLRNILKINAFLVIQVKRSYCYILWHFDSGDSIQPISSFFFCTFVPSLTRFLQSPLLLFPCH